MEDRNQYYCQLEGCLEKAVFHFVEVRARRSVRVSHFCGAHFSSEFGYPANSIVSSADWPKPFGLIEVELDYLLFDDRRADAIAQFSNRDVGTIFRVSLGYVDSSILYNYVKEGANRHLFIHQAMSRCIQELGAHVVHVVMDRSDDLFFCRIELEVARQQRSLDCGIADGYAIAIITERPFYISQKALENYVK